MQSVKWVPFIIVCTILIAGGLLWLLLIPDTYFMYSRTGSANAFNGTFPLTVGLICVAIVMTLRFCSSLTNGQYDPSHKLKWPDSASKTVLLLGTWVVAMVVLVLAIVVSADHKDACASRAEVTESYFCTL